MDATLRERYEHWKRVLSAKAGHADWRDTRGIVPLALSYAREDLRQRATLARLGEWSDVASGPYDSFGLAELQGVPAPYVIEVGIGYDDMPTDWGDCEPTDDERENTTSFYVFVRVMEDGEEVYHDGIGGVDVIDLPGYLQRDWQDAVAYALNDYLLSGAEAYVRCESIERAEWEARDVVTVGEPA